MEIVSNCQTGFFRPLPYTADSLIVFKYGGKGFLPGIIPIIPQSDVSAVRYLGQAVVDKYPILKAWKAPSPASVNLDSFIIGSGDYRPLKNIRLASAYPVLTGYKDYTTLGLRANFSDPLAMDYFTLAASFAPVPSLKNDERLHAEFTYNHWPWKISATYNRSDFYDLFGPTKTSRKGYSLGLRYENYYINDKPEIFKYTIQFYGFGGLEKVPDFQNIAASAKELVLFRARWEYSYLLRSLGAVEYEKGLKWQLTIGSNYAGKFYPSLHSEFDYGFLLPINHSSVWLRSSAGLALGRRQEPFANFYFGGFGNNWIDHQAINRYREFYSFPGIKLNAVGGINYGKFLAEWDFPPIRFRRIGLPSFYFTWMRLALFSGTIATNLDRRLWRRTLFNSGAQLNWKIVLLSHLDVTLSAGYALAFERQRPVSPEFMISLKIL